MIEPLDAEVTGVLDRLGLRIRNWQRISTLRAAETGRSVFRVELDDGRVVKARRLESAAAARRLFELRQELPRGFAPALHCVDAVVIEAWIDGQILGDGRRTAELLIAAAALLARLHSTSSARGRSLPDRQSTGAERDAAELARRRLAAHGYLDRADNDRVGAALAHRDPGAALVGLVHTDFCGENIVIGADGTLHVIDNERIDLGTLGLDVARTWYRWMLPAAEWRCFIEAYRGSMSHDDSLRHLPFWTLVATLKSAALFARIEPERVHVPMEALRKLLSESWNEAAGGSMEGSGA